MTTDVMDKVYDKFDFIGNVELAKKQSLRIREKLKGTDTVKDSVKFMLTGSGNRQFINVDSFISATGDTSFYAVEYNPETKKTTRTKRPFADRLNPTVINNTPNFAKLIVDMETDMELKEKYMECYHKSLGLRFKKDATADDIAKGNEYYKEFKELSVNRKEFLHENDVVEYLAEVLPTIAGKFKLHIKGDIVPSFSKGRTYVNYSVKEFELLPLDTADKFDIFSHIFFDKDALDESDFAETRQIDVSAYMQGYCRNSKEVRLFPVDLVINHPSVENEELQTMIDGKVAFMKSTFEMARNSSFYCMPFRMYAFNGAEEVEFDIDDLTPYQKLQVESGVTSIDQFKSKKLSGNKVELKLVEPLSYGAFSDFDEGAVEQDFRSDDIFDLMAVDNSDKKLSDVKKTEVKEEVKAPAQESTEKVEETSADLQDELDRLLAGVSM